MGRKKKYVADGQVAIDIQSAKTLDELAGFDELSLYKTNKIDQYIKQLEEMNITDMQRECIRCGLHPKDSRERMIANLTNEFQRHQDKVNASKIKPVIVKSSKKFLDLLSGGANQLR
jgi:hypothetical protein